MKHGKEILNTAIKQNRRESRNTGDKTRPKTYPEFVSEVAKDIPGAVERKDWNSVRADLTLLSEQVSNAIVGQHEENLKHCYDSVERAYSMLITRHRLPDTVFDAVSAAAELRTLTRLLTIAYPYQKAPGRRER